MTKEIVLFLPNAIYEELLYQYEDKDAELRKLIFGFLKPLGKQGKLTILNEFLQCKEFVKGKLEVVDHNLKDFKIDDYELIHDSKWIPEKVTREEIKDYKLVISDRLFEDLISYVKVYRARTYFYNKSIDKKSKDFKESDIAPDAKCFEQVIQDNAVSSLQQTLTQNIDKEYDEEFAELEKKIAVKPSRKKKNPK